MQCFNWCSIIRNTKGTEHKKVRAPWFFNQGALTLPSYIFAIVLFLLWVAYETCMTQSWLCPCFEDSEGIYESHLPYRVSHKLTTTWTQIKFPNVPSKRPCLKACFASSPASCNSSGCWKASRKGAPGGSFERSMLMKVALQRPGPHHDYIHTATKRLYYRYQCYIGDL